MYIKILLIVGLLSLNIFAIDAQMQIVKTKTSIPIIAVGYSGKYLPKVMKIIKLIKKDLLVSSHFEVYNKYFKKINSVNYVDFTQRKVDLLLEVFLSNSKINISLYDINAKKLLFSKIFDDKIDDKYPFLAHKISINVNDYLKAPKINWMKRKVIFAKYHKSGQSNIIISDYTLTYQKIVVSGGLNIFPKWSNANQDSFYFTDMNKFVPTLMKKSVKTSRLTKILSSQGMIVCSSVSKDGNNILVTMSPNMQPDIYVYDIKSKIKKRLTSYSGIDVAGNFYNNDKDIVFVSDRLKYPNIFIKKIGAKNASRLIYHGKNNSQVAAFGDFAVYSSREEKNEFGYNIFNLYLLSFKTDYLQQLTIKGRNQFPNFSNEGDTIMFIKIDNNKSFVGIIRLDYLSTYLFPLKFGKLQSVDW